jgi:hypothetical protein
MSKVGTGDSKDTLYCSFCGKSQHEVRKLIAGPTVFICEECVELCMDIIGEENEFSLVKSRNGHPAAAHHHAAHLIAALRGLGRMSGSCRVLEKREQISALPCVLYARKRHCVSGNEVLWILIHSSASRRSR